MEIMRIELIGHLSAEKKERLKNQKNMPKEKVSKKKLNVAKKVNPNYLDSKTTEKILLQAQELDNEEEDQDEQTKIRNIKELKDEEEIYENETAIELSKEEESIFESFTNGNISNLILSKFEQDVEVKTSHLHPQVVKVRKYLIFYLIHLERLTKSLKKFFFFLNFLILK